MNTAAENTSITTVSNPAANIRILKIATCPSLSGKSTLTYHVGCNADGEIMFRVYSNSGSGFFSNEWISMSSIQKISNTIPLDKPITSFMLLSPVYVGRSQNSFGFGLAVLKQEKMVVPALGDDRVYMRTDGAAFYAEVKALIESDVNIQVPDEKLKPSLVKKVDSKADVSSSAGKPDSKPEVSSKKSASKLPKGKP